MRSGVHARHGVLRGGRWCRCGGVLHDVLDHSGLTGLAHVTHITDAATATPVADGTTDATAADAISDATATTTSAAASAVTFCVRGGVVALRGVPLRHRQLLMLDDR